jgi:hypothetical protein
MAGAGLRRSLRRIALLLGAAVWVLSDIMTVVVD